MIAGFRTYPNITAGVGQNIVNDNPHLLADGVPYCSISQSNTPLTGGTYMQQYQWRTCGSCAALGAKDATFLSVCAGVRACARDSSVQQLCVCVCANSVFLPNWVIHDAAMQWHNDLHRSSRK